MISGVAAAPSEAQSGSGRTALRRRVGAGAALGVLVALVASDLAVTGMRTWWDRHAFTACVVSSLLVVAVTVLVVDEIIARRQRNERATSVAVQSIIVYGQALRADNAMQSALLAATSGEADGLDAAQLDAGRDEVRSLASMILIASPALFDDPEARLFLEAVQRLAATMYAGVGVLSSSEPGGRAAGTVLARRQECRAEVDGRIGGLAARLPMEDRAPLEDLPELGDLRSPRSSTGMGQRGSATSGRGGGDVGA